jgi:DNA-binding transcriptional ArsR family regulator
MVDKGRYPLLPWWSTERLSITEVAMAADALSRAFSALADPTRRDIVTRLAVADATVNELAAPYDVSLQAVSKHLRVLEDAGLVSRSREAQRRPVHLEAEVLDLMTGWIERYRRRAEDRYRRLDDVLRSMPDPPSAAAAIRDGAPMPGPHPLPDVERTPETPTGEAT